MLVYPTLRKIKSILFVIMVTKLQTLMVDIANQCKKTDVKMQFTSLLKKCLKKLNNAKKKYEKSF